VTDNTWEEVDDNAAKEKVSQVLRDAVSSLEIEEIEFAASSDDNNPQPRTSGVFDTKCSRSCYSPRERFDPITIKMSEKIWVKESPSVPPRTFYSTDCSNAPVTPYHARPSFARNYNSTALDYPTRKRRRYEQSQYLQQDNRVHIHDTLSDSEIGMTSSAKPTKRTMAIHVTPHCQRTHSNSDQLLENVTNNQMEIELIRGELVKSPSLPSPIRDYQANI
jgi:hypothetical protein